MSAPRGTTNRDARGSTADRAARRAYLLRMFGNGVTAPCSHCGVELTDASITVDRIVPGCEGGKYTRDNIRPSCMPCACKTGGLLGSRRRIARAAA